MNTQVASNSNRWELAADKFYSVVDSKKRDLQEMISNWTNSQFWRDYSPPVPETSDAATTDQAEKPPTDSSPARLTSTHISDSEAMKLVGSYTALPKDFSPTDGLQLHLYDCGGQSEYYAAHQLFLPPEAIYILVLTLNDSEGKIERDSLKWIRALKSRVSPQQIVIVLTQCDKVL